MTDTQCAHWACCAEGGTDVEGIQAFRGHARNLWFHSLKFPPPVEKPRLTYYNGIDIKEPAADLGIAIAIVSCFKDKLVDNKTVIVGEIGLSGEVRSITNLEKRLIEAEKLGFKTAVIPKSNEKSLSKDLKIKLVGVNKVTDALKECCF